MVQRLPAKPPRAAARPSGRRRRSRTAPARNWRAILGFRRADALWLRDRLLPCALLTAVAAVFVFLLRSPLFDIHRVRVVGAPAALTGEVVRAAGIGNRNLFTVNPSQLQARILTIPDLQHSHVTLHLPDAIDITVVAYDPVAVWLSGINSYLVTDSGIVIKPGDAAGLLHVRDDSGKTYQHGDAIDPSTVRAAFTLRDLLAAQKLSGQDFTFVDPRSLSVRAGAGWQAVFDITGDVARQVRVLSALLARGTPFQLVDLRFGNEPYFR